MTVAYNAAGSGRKNTATVTFNGNAVTVDVMKDMMVNDIIVVTYHNVIAFRGLTSISPVNAKLSITDKLRPRRGGLR